MFSLLAQAVETTTNVVTTAPATRPAPWWAQILNNQLFILVLIMAVMWFFVLRGKRNQDKARKDMLSEMKKGDRVQTIGGIIGTIVEARESDVLVKVDESNNTKIRFSRSAIHRVLADDKVESK
jgi:preprotein translocase subunit YajC